MDALISCLPPPLLPTNLHFSTTTMLQLSPEPSAFASSSSHHSPLLLADLPSPYYAPHAAAVSCDSVLVAADSPKAPPGRRNRHHSQALAPSGGRAGKRRSRASKRVPTTYISTDPANFRLMVQHITGAHQPDPDAAEVDMMMLQATAGLDAAAAAALLGAPHLLPVHNADDEAALQRHRQQQQQPCFPTLDSWNVMYESNAADLL